MNIEEIKKRLEGYLYLYKDLPHPNYVPNDDIISILSIIEQAEKALEQISNLDMGSLSFPHVEIALEALQAIRGSE